MRKFLKYVHRYMGYVVGIIVAVVCISGSILVFEKELTTIINRKLYSVTVNREGTPLKTDALLSAIDRQLNGEVEMLTVSRNPERSWALTIKNSREVVYVNPYTGEVLGKAAARHSFFITTMKLHRFLLADKVGRIIVGVSTIIFVFMLISGLAVWLPKKSGSIQNFFKRIWSKASFAKSPGRYRKFYDWHVLPALLIFPFILVMALTGPTWSFGWYKKGFYAALGAEVPARTGHESRGDKGSEKEKVREVKPVGYPKQNIGKFDGVEEALVAIKKASVDAKEYSIVIPARDGELQMLTIPKNPLTSRQTNRFTYSLKEHRIVKTEMWSEKAYSDRMSTYIYAFHTGTWAGVWSKVIYFFVVLVGGMLPITGFAMLIARKYRSRVKVEGA